MSRTIAQASADYRQRRRAREQRMREALQVAQVQLEKAADQFAFYVEEHFKKQTADGDAKAMTNHQWALACAKAYHVAREALK